MDSVSNKKTNQNRVRGRESYVAFRDGGAHKEVVIVELNTSSFAAPSLEPLPPSKKSGSPSQDSLAKCSSFIHRWESPSRE